MFALRRWSDEAAEAQQAPQRSGPPPTDAHSKGSMPTHTDRPLPADDHANGREQLCMRSTAQQGRPYGGSDAQDKESLHSRESQQSKPPSIVDTQEKDPLQSQPSSVLNTLEREQLHSQ